MYGDNIYYNPEKFGLRPVIEIDFSDGFYQFDIRVIWKDANGRLYTARDSGCSCPRPFEDYTAIKDLEVVNFRELIDEARGIQKDALSDGYDRCDLNTITDWVADLKDLWESEKKRDKNDWDVMIPEEDQC